MRKWISFAKKIWQSNVNLLENPFKLTFVITKECHSKCLNCDIWRYKPKNELTTEEIIKLSKNSPFLSWIDFTGGEPTDRKDFVQVIKTFVDNCPELLFVHFPTNGLKPARTEEICRELVKNGTPNLTVTVSIDGPEETNDHLRGIPGDFKKAVQTYQKLSTVKGLSVFIGMTLYENNVATVQQAYEEINKIVPSFKYNKFHINIPHVSAHYYGNSEANPKPNLEMVKAVDKYMKIRGIPKTPFDFIERVYQRKIKRYVESNITPIPCSALSSSCFLNATGIVYPCNIWDAPLGNIRDNGYSLLPIIKGEKAKTLKQQIKEKNCPNCWTPCEAYQSILSNLSHLLYTQQS